MNQNGLTAQIAPDQLKNTLASLHRELAAAIEDGNEAESTNIAERIAEIVKLDSNV